MEMYWREGVLGIRGAGGGNGEDEGGRGGFVEGLRTGEVMKMLGWESLNGGVSIGSVIFAFRSNVYMENVGA